MRTTIDYAGIGFGPVIQELVNIANGFPREKWNLKWIGRRSGLFNSRLARVGSSEVIFDNEQSRGLDAVFIGIPSAGDGAVAEKYARHFLRRGTVVVTAEKALQSCRPGLANRHSRSFGFSATVGGNVDVLNTVSRDPFGVTEVFGIPNITFNYLRWRIMSGDSYSDAIAGAKREKFMESENLQEEILDALRKGIILFNQIAKLSHPLCFCEVKSCAVSDADIRFALAMDCTCVMKVSAISGKAFMGSPMNLTICRLRKMGWQLEVGFQNAFALPFQLPVEDRNIFSITNRAGERYQIFGQGAGVKPTAGAMFADARRLLGFK